MKWKIESGGKMILMYDFFYFSQTADIYLVAAAGLRLRDILTEKLFRGAGKNRSENENLEYIVC